MYLYTYEAPLVKSSTKKCLIQDTQGKVIGSIQRYFKSPFHRLIDGLIGGNHLIVRMKAKSFEGEFVIDAYTEMAMIKKPNYYINFYENQMTDKKFKAIQTNHINIMPEFSIKNSEFELMAKESNINGLSFYEMGYEVARWNYKISQRNKAYIEISAEATLKNPLFYAVLGHLLYFIGY